MEQAGRHSHDRIIRAARTLSCVLALAAGPAYAQDEAPAPSLSLELNALQQQDEELRGEAADLLFHLTVLLAERGLTLADVGETLVARHRERVPAQGHDAN